MSTLAKDKSVYIRVGHRYVKTMGTFSAQGGASFDVPVDMTWDSKGNVYVVSRPIEIVRITAFRYEDEEYLGEFATTGTEDGQLAWPGFMAVDSSDRLPTNRVTQASAATAFHCNRTLLPGPSAIPAPVV